MIGGEKLRTGLVCLVLVLGTALLYAPVLNFSYVTLDDPIYLINNFHVNNGFTWEGLRWCVATSRASMWHPLTWVSFMLDCQLYRQWLGGPHATNVVLHILSTVLLFLLLRRMTGAFWRSAMVAALFAWHPLHVESVAWLSERKDVLCTVFWMLTLWAYLRYAEESKAQISGSDPRHRRGVVHYLLAVGFFVLGLMAKPMLVTLPFVFLLLDWWPLGRLQFKSGAASKSTPSGALKPALELERFKKKCSRGLMGNVFGEAPNTAGEGARAPQKSRRFSGYSFHGIALVLEKSPFFLISIIFCILTMAIVRGATFPVQAPPITERLGNCLVSYFRYAAKTIWPENMVLLYPYEFHWAAWQIMLAGIFVVAVSGAALRLRRTRPYFLFGWLWYLGILVPVIGLVQVAVEQMADRYSYIPSIGLFVIICWGAYDLVGGWRHGKLLLGVLGWAALLACSILAGKQLQYWENSDTVFTHNLEVTPDNYIVRATYAAYFYNEKQLARAIEESQKSIRINPGYATSHIVLGNALLQQGNAGQAVAQLLLALQIDPSSSDARLGYGKGLLAQNQPAEAERQLTMVLAADPGRPEAQYWLGRAQLKEGKLAEACAQFAKCSKLARKFPDAQFQLAVILAREGKIMEAMENYRQAKNVPVAAPDCDVMNNLAWIMAASPLAENRDGAQAVQLATRARDLDHSQHAVIIGTLAAAYAEAGRFDEAMAAAQQAHDLALAQGAKELAARNLDLLAIYRSHRAGCVTRK